MAHGGRRGQVWRSITGLVHGVEQVKYEIESLREPVDHSVESLHGIAEVKGVAFAVEKIVDWVKEIPEGAEKIDILADALGTTTSTLSEFQNISKLAESEGGNLPRVFSQLGKQ